jgi:hypothetical protein
VRTQSFSSGSAVRGWGGGGGLIQGLCVIYV